jgi:hypothetical protein
MSLLDRLTPRRVEPQADAPLAAPEGEGPPCATKALRKFLATLSSRSLPTLLDLGPVVGANVSFFGEQLGCKVIVEDVYSEIERHLRDGSLHELPVTLAGRFPQADASVDGVLCWDVFDYLDRQASQVLAEQITRLLSPEGAILCFFGSSAPASAFYTKYVIVDDQSLRHRPYPASRARQGSLLNRDIIRLFPSLRVSDSYLMKNNVREILFRKPAYETR